MTEIDMIGIGKFQTGAANCPIPVVKDIAPQSHVAASGSLAATPLYRRAPGNIALLQYPRLKRQRIGGGAFLNPIHCSLAVRFTAV
jgi:hypothetical protein